jgi:hypothetical protein
MGLSNAIINTLKQGSIPRIILFSDTDTFPEPPYVVVKMESGIREGTRGIRIIVHNKIGFFDDINAYALKELDSWLIDNGMIYDEDGDRYKLYPEGYTDITPDEGDNTYFMERLYSCPLTIRT